MTDRRKSDRRTNPAVPEPLERKKERRQEERRASVRRPATLIVRQGKRAGKVEGELGLGGASFSLAWAPSGPSLTIDHRDSAVSGLEATVTQTKTTKAGHEVHVVFKELATTTELALAKWLDGV